MDHSISVAHVREALAIAHAYANLVFLISLEVGGVRIVGRRDGWEFIRNVEYNELSSAEVNPLAIMIQKIIADDREAG